MWGPRLRLTTGLLLAAAIGAPSAGSGAPLPSAAADIVELQPFRRSQSHELLRPGGAAARVALVDLAPQVGRVFLLEVADAGGRESYVLETPTRAGRRLALAPESPDGVVLLEPGGGREACPLLAGDPTPLAVARSLPRAFVPLCNGRLFLRNRVPGHKTNLEWTTDFLRDNVWGGEQLTVWVRQALYRDAFLLPGTLADPLPEQRPRARPAGAPRQPAIDPRAEDHWLAVPELGFSVSSDRPGYLRVGRWYPLEGLPGAFVSALRPDLVDPAVVARQAGRTAPLDPVESAALVFAVAFDLDRFDLGFAMGTEHPRVGWSDRALDSVRDPDLPGPDGFASPEPLVTAGMLSPADATRVAATFAGGFRRRHAAFRYGALATRNRGSHYGVIEKGVVFSRLQPGLATLLVDLEGRVDMRTWTAAAGDAEALASVVDARQNGVPILEPDPTSGEVRPGALLRSWGAGNWSGSQEGKLRTVRAGICLAETEATSYLLYGYFSSVTPSAMARVFGAYHCRYAMMTDINALEHTYLAAYPGPPGARRVEHLVRGMSVLDKEAGGVVVPRFVGFADNRDFFYLLRREP